MKLGLLEERDGVERRQPLFGARPVVERLAVERDAVLRAARFAQQAVDGLERAVLRLWIERVRAAIEDERALGVLLRFEELTGAIGKLRRRRLVGLDLAELRREDLGETALGIGDASQPLELRPRRLIGDVFGQELRGRLQRGPVVLLLLLVELGDPTKELTAIFGIFARIETRLERRHHAAPVEPREVHRFEHLRGARGVRAIGHERLERGHGRRVLRVDFERALVLLERPIDLAQSLLEHHAEAVMERGLPLGGVSWKRDLPLVEVDQIFPALGRRVEALERVERVGLHR